MGRERQTLDVKVDQVPVPHPLSTRISSALEEIPSAGAGMQLLRLQQSTRLYTRNVSLIDAAYVQKGIRIQNVSRPATCIRSLPNRDLRVYVHMRVRVLYYPLSILPRLRQLFGYVCIHALQSEIQSNILEDERRLLRSVCMYFQLLRCTYT